MLSPAWKPNYIWYVQEHAERAELTHPVRKIFDKPEAFEFATPLNATYPPWFDPCYWLQGCKIYFIPVSNLIAAITNIIYYSLILFLACFVITILVHLSNQRSIFSAQSVTANTIFFVPSLIGFGQYLTV